MFCASFVLVAASYRALPPEISVLRISLAHLVLWAHKSPFMVFRVPLMNLIHGVMAAFMLSRAPVFTSVERRRAYSNLFLALLFTVAFKSDFEALEFFVSSSPALLPYAGWGALGALASVVVGLGVALIFGRRVPLPWTELRLSIRDWVILSGLFAIYLAVVIGSLAQGHRA